MELRRRLDLRGVLTGIYVLAALIYVVCGLQPADATNYEIATELTIPGIGLEADVTKLQLEEHELKTPDTIVGSFSNAEHKTLLIGHASTAFRKLAAAAVGEAVYYDEDKYVITEINVMAKESIDMSEVLAAAETDTLVMMTCAGEDLGGGDATHRLIITAAVE